MGLIALSSRFRPLFHAVKSVLMPAGVRPYRVPFGLNRGLVLQVDAPFSMQRILGLYEREIAAHVRRYSSVIATAVDVGAGDGYYASYFIAKSTAKTVLVFEPDAGPAGLLERNLTASRVHHPGKHVVAVRKFVGRREGALHTTLDEFRSEIVPPCLIKVDVEGHEADVLAGASAVLALDDVVWVIETHSIAAERDCIEILKRSGYRTRVVANAWWRRFLPESRGLPHNRWLVSMRSAT